MLFGVVPSHSFIHISHISSEILGFGGIDWPRSLISIDHGTTDEHPSCKHSLSLFNYKHFEIKML
jgi:hypothetical protein